MIRSLQQIRNRIRSIESTKKVTSAMEMISIAKLNYVEKLFVSLRPYFSKFESLVYDLLNSQHRASHPFLEARALPEKICLCVITSDGGLCGLYNNEIIRETEEFIKAFGKDKISLVCVGKKGFTYFKKRSFEILNAYTGLHGRYSDEIAEKLSNNLIDIFTRGAVSQVYIAYMHCKTAFLHKPRVEKFLNIEKRLQDEREYIFEPKINAILEQILPNYVLLRLKLIILGSFTAEHAARSLAMKTATDNAKDLLDGLIMLKNKVRQANITQELLEIISSSEALKG